MKFNPEKHNTDTDYLRGILADKGLSQREAAKKLGINERTMRSYLDPRQLHPIPYIVQFALEHL